jgi:hypothetical protein
VKHFSAPGLQPRAFACSQDDNGKTVAGIYCLLTHGVSTLPLDAEIRVPTAE